MSEKPTYPDYIKSALKSIIQEEYIKDAEIIQIHNMGKAGEGYLGTLHRIHIKGTNKHLHLIVKCSSSNIEVRKVLPLRQTFDTEIYFYRKVMREFYEFQEDKLIENQFRAPKSYKLCNKDLCEFLILQDMDKIGFEPYNRKQPMDPAHVEAVFKEYSKLHALSFAIKDQKPETFFEMAKNLGNVFNVWFVKGGLLQILKILYGRNKFLIDETNNNKFYKAYVKLCENMENVFLGYNYKDDKLAVITHTDCWTNNMLFKYEINSGAKRISKMTLLDFQLSRCCSSINDLTLFLYACADETIWNDLYKYLDIYYNSLCDNLKLLGTDPNKIMSKESFYEQYRRYAYFGLIMAAFWIRVNIMEEDEAPNLEDGEAFVTNFATEKRNENLYKSKYQSLLNHFINFDLLS